MIVIYHNPNCKLTKKCIKILETEHKNEFQIKHENLALSENKLKKILNLLNFKPVDIIKTSHVLWKTLFKALNFTDEELIKIIIEYPSLIKSPIVINGNKAIIGRPPETILNVI
jgi:arsenate reductase